MSWPVDTAKLDRVRALMKDRDLTALVVRAPDNILYLTNYWCMKGYDVAIFPREGEPILCVIEPQLSDAERNAWTRDLRLFKGYDERDTRPPNARALDLAMQVLKERGLTDKVAVELTNSTQDADRMVGEPTVYSQTYFDAFKSVGGQVVDAMPLLIEARSIKTAQEIERMRLANELAALAMEHCRHNMKPGMKESEVGAMFEGFVHGVGVGYKKKVEMARAFTLVWSGPGIATFTATGDRPIQKNEPTLFEIWVCVDGYWNDLTKNLCPGPLSPKYNTLLELLLKVFNEAIAFARDGAALQNSIGSSARASPKADTPASPRIPSPTASARERTSRPTRIRLAPVPSAREWSSPSSPASTGRAAAVSGWRTTFSLPQTAMRSYALSPTTFGQ